VFIFVNFSFALFTPPPLGNFQHACLLASAASALAVRAKVVATPVAWLPGSARLLKLLESA
jgi:hypothetical protein